MSWGYWGIVTGLLVLLVLFFICVEILNRIPQSTARGDTGFSGGKESKTGSGRHAA